MAAWVSLGVSIAALVASVVALYRSYLAPSRVWSVPGALRLRIYRYDGGGSHWWVPVFHVTVSFTNVGARPGTVDGLRLRVTRVGVVPSDNFETFRPIVTLGESLGLKNDSREEREVWLEEAAEWSPFVVLPKASVSQHLVFQAGAWDVPVERPLRVILERHDGRGEDWVAVESWKLEIDAASWLRMAEGMAMPGRAGSRVDTGPRSFPESLAS
jgi:hypothetical protein